MDVSRLRVNNEELSSISGKMNTRLCILNDEWNLRQAYVRKYMLLIITSDL